jgi:hypothetical protein
MLSLVPAINRTAAKQFDRQSAIAQRTRRSMHSMISSGAAQRTRVTTMRAIATGASSSCIAIPFVARATWPSPLSRTTSSRSMKVERGISRMGKDCARHAMEQRVLAKICNAKVRACAERVEDFNEG